jgi:hypothetical protein
MLFAKQLKSNNHTRAFVVDQADEHGWEVRVEQDHKVVERTWLHDWHRVESAMRKFALEALQLQRAGWVDVTSSAV